MIRQPMKRARVATNNYRDDVCVVHFKQMGGQKIYARSDVRKRNVYRGRQGEYIIIGFKERLVKDGIVWIDLDLEPEEPSQILKSTTNQEQSDD